MIKATLTKQRNWQEFCDKCGDFYHADSSCKKCRKPWTKHDREKFDKAIRHIENKFSRKKMCWEEMLGDIQSLGEE